jgi:glucan phosphoethanolaminetransferase (alkaline phosphatase superfamily)
MGVGIAVFVILALIVIIWIALGIKGIKQKFFSILLILVILFLFVSFGIVFKGEDISVDNISDVGRLGKIYYSWLLNAFNNVKVVTTQAIKMNWETNSTT